MQFPGIKVADDVVFLLGRPPLQEYIAFVKVQTVNGASVDAGPLADEWRAANDHITSLEAGEAGHADNPDARPIPVELAPLTDAVLGHPMTRNAFSLLPLTVEMVPLDQLVVFQKFINLRYAAELRAGLGDQPTQENVFRFCLDLDPALPQFVPRQVAANSYIFQSPSQDFRFLEAVLLRPEQLVGHVSGGHIGAVLALAVGYGSNFLQTIRADGRLILGNGSHRAYVLREMGITHAPALVQTVSRRDEVPTVGIQEVVERADAFLTAARPPLLKDYFDPQLRRMWQVPRSQTQIRISFGVDVTSA